MSIAQKLQDILDCKDAIKTAIAGKGGTITDATPLADYATAIDNLPSGGDIGALIDNTISGHFDIPSGTRKVAANKFSNCNQLTSIGIPDSVISIDTAAFYLCTALGDDFIANYVTTVGQNGVRHTKITSLHLPRIVTIGTESFNNNSLLVDVFLGESITSIGWQCFGGSRNAIFRIMATTPPTLSTGFVPANYLGKIYVPDASVNDYKTASNWSAWASFIYPLSDYTP